MKIPLAEITTAQIIGLNRTVIAEARSKDPKCKQQHRVNDRNKLEARVSSIFQQLNGIGYVHLPIEKMAGLLLYRIAEAQAFEDGNKRTALISMVAFLHNNGHRIRIHRQTVNDLIWGFAVPMTGGSAKYNESDSIQYIFDNILP